MLITGKTVAAGFLVAFCGYAFGAIFAWLCKLNVAQITAGNYSTFKTMLPPNGFWVTLIILRFLHRQCPSKRPFKMEGSPLCS